MELIKNWLSGKRNFVVGAVLYKKFGKDEKLKKLFDTRTPDQHLEARLAAELEALMQQPKVVLQQPAKRGDADEMPKSGDAVLQAIHNEWMPLYQKMNYLRHELDRYEDNTPDQVAQRKALAIEILQLEQQCMQLWTKRDHYMKHGQLPEVKEQKFILPEDPLEAAISIDTLRRNVRRNRQLAQKHPDKPVYVQKLKMYTEQLQQALNKIKDESPGEQTG